MTQQSKRSPAPQPTNAGVRWFLAVFGVLLAGLGAVGVLIPGLPTTPFLLAASYCFARSFPALERRLLRTKLFAPYARYLDRDEPLTTRMRVTILIAVWACVALSGAALWWTGALNVWLIGLLGLGAAFGSLVILRFRRGTSK